MEKLNIKSDRVILVIFFTFVILLLSLSLGPDTIYAGLLAEDGPVETSTAVFYFLAAYLCLKIFFLRIKSLSRRDFLFFIVGALFFFVGAEEISWGQRIIGFQSPFFGTSINVVNTQGEFNIHNIEGLDSFIYMGGFFFLVLSTGVLPLLRYFFKKIEVLCTRYGLPLMPRSICLSFWMGFLILVLFPQIRYSKGDFFTIFYSRMHTIEELREFYFSFLLFSYIFVEYFHLIKYKRPYGIRDTGYNADASGDKFSFSIANDPLLIIKNNVSFALLVIFLCVFLPRYIDQLKFYRLHTDKQIFYTDPDIILIEGEHIRSSNLNYWFKSQKGLFGDKYMSLYSTELPQEKYIFFKYDFQIKKPGTYRLYIAGTPPGSREETSFRHHFHSPYQVFIDGSMQKDVSLENSREFMLQKEKFSFYLHYEYVDDFYVTKLGEFYLKTGKHEIEFRVSEKAGVRDVYNFYVDAILFTPKSWTPKKTPRVLSPDIFSH